MKFSEIEPLTRMGACCALIGWPHIEGALRNYSEGMHNDYLQLDPEFKRAHVWDEIRQQKYVEYILRGGHSSKIIYWNCAGWMSDFRGPMYLVDGKQRLESVRKFMRGDLPIFGGKVLSDFTDSIPTTSAYFTFHVNDLPNYQSVLQWYLDLNAGGVAHTEEELGKVKLLLDKEKSQSEIEP